MELTGSIFIICVILAVSTWASFAAVKRRVNVAAGALWTIWCGFTVAMFVAMEQASGWDGLLYLAGLIVLSAPSGVGLIIGTLVGLAGRKDETNDALA